MRSIYLDWQSKLVLLAVVPVTAIAVALDLRVWSLGAPQVLLWTLGLSGLLGLLAWASHSGTPAAAAAGALINASLMLSTAIFPYRPWETAVVPVLVLLVLTSLATRFGRARKERLGLAEEKRGRDAAQVCANLGFAALASSPEAQSWLIANLPDHVHIAGTPLLFAPALAALAEAAADTISSEIGQVLGGTPRMLTTLRRVSPGTDGAISATGTLAGALAAAVIAGAGTLALRGDWRLFALSAGGGVFGLLFDSLLGATLERKGWLNNDAVNFLSTASAAGIALALLAQFTNY